MDEWTDEEVCIEPPPRFNYKKYLDSSHPCFRDTYLYSLSASTFLGLSMFMLTSNTRRSLNLALFTFIGGFSTLWITCEIKRRNDDFKIERIAYGVREYSEKDGVNED